MAERQPVLIQTGNLENTFNALRRQDPMKLSKEHIPYHADYKEIPNQNYAPPSSFHMGRQASIASAGTIYTQPQFFSPVHTPINWQIPSKRIEQYQWARFFYHNEPKVAASIDFYSAFPINEWEHECKNRDVKRYFDKFKKKLELTKWTRYISHELHLLGDCFILQEVHCESCGGSGKMGDMVCDHEGGTVRRVLILNPDFVDVYSSPIDPEPMISFRPDETLITMVQRQEPGSEKLAPEVAKKIASGQPILLDNRNVSHIAYGKSGYETYGTGMVRRLFPILSYKTKLMVAQWIVAERLILPIKVVKVGNEERPAGPADIAAVQQQFAQTANDPNSAIIVHHAFEIDFVGAQGHVLTLSNEFELINQEILDGMMINNALLNGEGPAFQSAAVGIEAMIQRLDTFRKSLSDWIEESIYLPEAIRQGFIEENAETGEEEWVYPKIKWRPMNLRDKNQDKSFAIQLYDKGILSAQTLLEEFGYDPDIEIERKRFDSIQMMALGGGMQGAPGNGMGGMGGAPPMPGGGGGLGDLGGGDAPIMPGGEGMGGDAGGGAPGGAPGAPAGGAVAAQTLSSVKAQVADPNQFGGKVLKSKNRAAIERQQKQVYREQERAEQAKAKELASQQDGEGGGWNRDSNGRIMYTKPERMMMERLQMYQKDGIIKYPVNMQHPVQVGGQEYPMDFAIPSLQIGIEVDGIAFHEENPKQTAKDQARDAQLNQMGWTIVRCTDEDVEKRLEQVLRTIIQTIMQKEVLIKQQMTPRDKARLSEK